MQRASYKQKAEPYGGSSSLGNGSEESILPKMPQQGLGWGVVLEKSEASYQVFQAGKEELRGQRAH